MTLRGMHLAVIPPTQTPVTTVEGRRSRITERTISCVPIDRLRGDNVRYALHRIVYFVCVFACATLGVNAPRSALAQTYTKLQVLLPGESPAPGTGTGKSGAPQSQTVGVP